MGSDSGTGRSVTILRKGVSTRGTALGMRLYSLVAMIWRPFILAWRRSVQTRHAPRAVCAVGRGDVQYLCAGQRAGRGEDLDGVCFWEACQEKVVAVE